MLRWNLLPRRQLARDRAHDDRAGRPRGGLDHAPGISTPRYALKDIDAEKFECRLAEWSRIQAPVDEPPALDGKIPSGSCWVFRRSCIAVRLISRTLATSHGPDFW